jgi:transcriptional regulator with XRE-family HTH domain
MSEKPNRWALFGQWVKQQRLVIISKTTGNPMTQGEAGRRAGISRVHWSRIEAGDTGVKEITIPLIAKALNRTTEDQIKEVYQRAGFAVEQEPFELPSSMRHFIELPPEIQQQIAKQVETYYNLLAKKQERGKK